jgi:hypothetical protein
MSGINLGRVLIGGIVAGVVANAGDYLINSVILAEDMAQLAQRLGLDQATVDASVPTWIAVDFIYGILLVFAYAAMRPRFGPGPRTAVIAGLTLYLAITAVLVGFMSWGCCRTPSSAAPASPSSSRWPPACRGCCRVRNEVMPHPCGKPGTSGMQGPRGFQG